MNKKRSDYRKECLHSVVIEELNFAYENDKVLKKISLSIKKKEKLGIIGPSGAGKSTLLLHLNGILCGQGKVIINGNEVNSESIKNIRKQVGIVFQNPDDQLFFPVVEDDIAFGLLNMGMSDNVVRQRVQEILQQLNLEGLEKKTSHHLSFGERKRVSLATVLVMRPSIIAFDEPFSNLDPETIRLLLDIIESLDTTVIIVSQQILPVFMSCDRIAVMNEGTILKVDKPEVIGSDKELLKKCGLDISFYNSILKKKGLDFLIS